MPFTRVTAWTLVAVLVCLWALYNRRIAVERTRLMNKDLPTPPQDKHAPL